MRHQTLHRVVVTLSLAALLWIGSAATTEPLPPGLDKPRTPAPEGLRVERDPATRTITVQLPDDPAERGLAPRGIYGKVVVRNRSLYEADIYWSLDDLITPWEFVDTLPPGWKVKFPLFKFDHYLLAADHSIFPGAPWEWGPRGFFLRRKYKWTLLP